MNTVLFMPRSASTIAPRTDGLYLALVAISAAILVLVFALIVIFAYRYRRGSAAPRGALPTLLQHEVEIGWTTATVFAFLFFFWWAGANEVPELLPPRTATEIHVVAKQWMWKVQHPNGVREIDMLHVPIGEPARLVMTSQDVIHSFSVPDFRIKSDILPGRYVEIWFEPTEIGTFRLFCTQFCGTAHSAMTGSIVVMSKPDFAKWLQSRPGGGDFVAQGRELFVSLGCAGCHTPGGPVHAPDFDGLFGRRVPLASGRFVLVDDAWIRDCILGHSTADPPAGYPPIMPSFKGEVDDGQILALTAYVRSLSPQTGATR
ncbi:MAG TPA: cytochrome c oxidase subunit II [Roseiarcus sp.]|jgi:cytochrome c oxidase subunit 2|nr:cytochrome c oxidase subunit II [Roseiarcus sp.]